MSDLVQFSLADGSTVLVQGLAGERPPLAFGDDQPTLRGRHDRATDAAESAAGSAAGLTAAVATAADRTFEAAVGSITPAAEAVVEQFRQISGGPEQIQIEFGIQLSAQAGAFIANVGGQANFKVTVTWKR